MFTKTLVHENFISKKFISIKQEGKPNRNMRTKNRQLAEGKTQLLKTHRHLEIRHLNAGVLRSYPHMSNVKKAGYRQ